MPLGLIEAVAERNCHVREMLELKRLAAKHGITNPRIEANLEAWVSDWLQANPRQAAFLQSKLKGE